VSLGRTSSLVRRELSSLTFSFPSHFFNSSQNANANADRLSRNERPVDRHVHAASDRWDVLEDSGIREWAD